uniref:Uncharacterized protein n=1 Tax=Clytia hemisphaerica TaxID=252671 RepID=A0A7M5X9Y9_9CNID
MERASQPVSYATQRFTSSSYNQWVKIFKSYGAYIQAFEHLHPNRSDDEEYQFQIKGADYVFDMLLLLDTLKPLVDVMLQLQSLDNPVWKLKKLFPELIDRLKEAGARDKDALPKLTKHEKDVKVCGKFDGVTLLAGWLPKRNADGTFTWTSRNKTDIRKEHSAFVKELIEALEKRIKPEIEKDHIETLAVLDAAELVKLSCGKRERGKIAFEREEGEIESYGVKEIEKQMKSISKADHISDSSLNFDSRMRYIGNIKKAVCEAIWENKANWFLDADNKIIEKREKLISFKEIKCRDFFHKFELKYDKSVEIGILDQSEVYKSFYSNNFVVSTAGKEGCTIIDVALSKGGPEAIAESFYNCMRNQQQHGGQSNWVLTTRAKIAWCLPSIDRFDRLIKDAVEIYINGDEKIKPHRENMFFTSSRHNSYKVSKVVDRINADCGRCPFLVSS